MEEDFEKHRSIDNNWLGIVRPVKIFKNRMIKITVVCLLLITVFSILLKAEDLHVMSFNILYSTAEPNNWHSERRVLVAETILQNDPDIVGMQEVKQHQFDELESDLADTYSMSMKWNNSYFGNAIAYRKTRFTEISSGMFTYSPTPDVAGTDFHQNNNSRYATWIVLNDMQTNRSVFVLSTHFFSPAEHTDERVWSSQILMARIQEFANRMPVIALGDFNFLETHEAYKEIVEYPYNPLTDTYRYLHLPDPGIEGTYHGHVYDYPANTNRSRIDYIFSAHMNILESNILHGSFDQKYPSDHFPITTRFTYGTVPHTDPDKINPGGIMGGKDYCSSFGAQKLNGAADAYGGCSSANIQYQWQRRRKDPCAVTWEPWVNTTGATYPSSSWSGDTRSVQFRRGAKRSDCGDWQYSNIITMDISTPITDAGEISGSFQSCGPVDPDPLVSVREASGGCGELEYMWQSRHREVCSHTWGEWVDYGNQTGATFDPAYWNMDRQLRRKARRKGCDYWLYSNIVTIDIFDPLSIDRNCNCTAMTTGTLRTTNTEGVHMYPNPVYESITINLSEAIGKEATLSVYDTEGRLVKSTTILCEEKNEIDFSELQPGMHFINLSLDNEVISRIIIKK